MLSLFQNSVLRNHLQNIDHSKALQADIDATDKAIDAMVYALYGLSEEEIAVVEGRA